MSCTAPGRFATETTRLVQSWPEALRLRDARSGWATIAKRVRLWASSWIAGADDVQAEFARRALAGDAGQAGRPGWPGARLRRCSRPAAARRGAGAGSARRGIAPAPAGAPAPRRCRRASSTCAAGCGARSRLVSPTMSSGVCQEQVERARDHAFAGVLDRHDAEVGGAGAGGMEHFVEVGARHAHDRRAEVAERGLLAEGAGRARGRRRACGVSSARHADMISRQIGATLSVCSGPGLAPCRPSITCASRSGRNTARAFGRLSSPTSLRQRGAAVQQRQQLAVDRVDAIAQCLQSSGRSRPSAIGLYRLLARRAADAARRCLGGLLSTRPAPHHLRRTPQRARLRCAVAASAHADVVRCRRDRRPRSFDSATPARQSPLLGVVRRSRRCAAGPRAWRRRPAPISVTPCGGAARARGSRRRACAPARPVGDQHDLVVGPHQRRGDDLAVALGLLDRDHALGAAAVARVLDDRGALAVAVLGGGEHALRSRPRRPASRSRSAPSSSVMPRTPRALAAHRRARRSRRSAPPCRRRRTASRRAGRR